MNNKKFLKMSLVLFAVLLFPLISAGQGQENFNNESCTSIMVGKKASTDGSVMTSHTCDAYYRTWLEFVPAKEHEPGTMHPVRWGTMHTSSRWSEENIEVKGEIPEAEKT
ncbi:MAG: C69 family dipeptidase, partial [Bacteroidales bacterium]|nr:C69 family dipeptidase [Bacteroidales bacterium]